MTWQSARSIQLTASPQNSEIQEAAPDSRQAAARARGQDPGDRQPRGAGAQDTHTAAVDQPAGQGGRRRERCDPGGGEARGAEEGDEEGEEGQDQGGQLPQVHVSSGQGRQRARFLHDNWSMCQYYSEQTEQLLADSCR